MNTPKTRLDEYEMKALNLGARMAAAGFSEEDNPYLRKDPMHEAWLTGHRWQSRLKVAA